MTLTLIVILAAALLVALTFLRSRPAPDTEDTGGTGGEDGFPVRTRDRFFTPSELAFWTLLGDTIHGADLPLDAFPKVRLNDVFEITDQAQQRRTYARLRDKHVDFLIVHRDTHRPLMGIEIDGRSHHSKTQQARDEVKNAAFAHAGLPLVRYQNGNLPDETALAQVLRRLLAP